jgi:hypothetical protein
MRIAGFAALFAPLALQSGSAFAQSPAARPPENITVTAPKSVPDSALDDFVKSYAKPSEPVGNMARWRVGICPAIAGLPADYASLIVARVRQISAEAGAPVGREGCRFTTDIVFSTKPPAVMDELREKHQILLGYHDNAEAARLATVSRPIQAWYTTETEDMDGYRQVDAKQNNRGDCAGLGAHA